MPIQSEDKLHPFGLLWSELDGTHARQAQPANTPSSGMSSHLMGHSVERVAPFGGVSDPGFEEGWSKFYDKASISSSNMFGESLGPKHFSHLEQEPSHREFADQIMSRQLQQQHIQQRNLRSQLPHLNDSPLEQMPTPNALPQHLANQPLSELEHFLALQQQRQLELQQHQQLQQQQQLHQQQLLIQEQQSQARQLLLEQVLRGTARDPGFAQSLINPNGASSILDQMSLKQHLLHDLQTHSHQPPRHSDPYIEQLIQAKLGQATHQEHQVDLLELMQHARHEQLRSHQLLQQEQLQARSIAGLRQRSDVGDGRSIGSVWPLDEADQFIRNPVISQRAHSAAFSPPAFSPLDVFQQQQRASQEEQLREFERNLQLQERLKRGFYDPEVVPFDQSIPLPSGGPGFNMDMVNAMAHLQGLDIQDPNSQMLSAAAQLGTFSSGAIPHPHRPFAPNELNISHFDGEGPWSDGDVRMSNMQSHMQRLHLNAEQQKREQQLGEDNSKRLLMELLHQKSNQQSTQPLNLNEGTILARRTPSGFFSGSSSGEHLFNLAQHSDADVNNQTGIASLANFSEGQTQLRLAEEQASGLDGSVRLSGRLNSGIAAEAESIYTGINQISPVVYNSSVSGKAFIDTDFSEVEGKKQVLTIEDAARGSALEPESLSSQTGMSAFDGREAVSRHNLRGLPGKFARTFLSSSAC